MHNLTGTAQALGKLFKNREPELKPSWPVEDLCMDTRLDFPIICDWNALVEIVTEQYNARNQSTGQKAERTKDISVSVTPMVQFIHQRPWNPMGYSTPNNPFDIPIRICARYISESSTNIHDLRMLLLDNELMTNLGDVIKLDRTLRPICDHISIIDDEGQRVAIIRELQKDHQKLQIIIQRIDRLTAAKRERLMHAVHDGLAISSDLSGTYVEYHLLRYALHPQFDEIERVISEQSALYEVLGSAAINAAICSVIASNPIVEHELPELDLTF